MRGKRIFTLPMLLLVVAGCGGASDETDSDESPLVAAKNKANEVLVMSNLKQIYLAMDQHNVQKRQFPAHASYTRDGQPLLSWRVHLLPYLQQDNLYRQFRLDEPWDSPHNKQLLSSIPAIYKTTDSSQDTTLMGFVGPGAFFDGNKGRRLGSISDGTRNSIMIVNAGGDNAVPWTKPEDLPFGEGDPATAVGAVPGNSVLALFCDGSVKPTSTNGDSFRAKITVNGNEIVQD